jgi:hypothetical protein
MQCLQDFHRATIYPLNLPWRTTTKSCFRGAKAVAAYLESLRSSKLLLYDLEYTEHSFQDLEHTSLSLREVSIADHSCTIYNCECKDDYSEELSTELKAAVLRIHGHSNSFICLDCLKEGSDWVRRVGNNCSHLEDLSFPHKKRSSGQLKKGLVSIQAN